MKPEVSIGVGLATAAVVYGVYNIAMPTVADVRNAAPNDKDIEAAEKTAAWTAAAVVAGISLIAKDATVFVIGGGMTVILSWWFKHGNQVNPETQMAVPKGDMLPEQFDESQMEQTEAYANAANGYNF